MYKPLFFISIFILCLTSSNAQDWEQLNDTPFETHHAIGFSANGYGYSLTGTYSRSFYQYDPTEDNWAQLDDYPGPTRGFGIGDTWDGKLYFGFGVQASGSHLNDLWVYDPDAEIFEQLPDCPGVGRAHPAFVILAGKIYMGMGSNFGAPDGGNLKDWWEYDIEIRSWKQLSDFPDAERHHPYQFAYGEYIYAGFGHGTGFISNEWYRYHPQSDMWEQVATLPAEGRVAGQQFSYKEKGYAISGQGENHGSMPKGEFWEYDAQLDEWTELPSHPGPSIWAPACFIIDGYVYLSTGEKDDPNSGVQLPSRTVYRCNIDALSTSTFEKEINRNFVVYPNPTSQYIHLKSEIQFKTASIINLQGKQLRIWTDFNEPINLAGFQPGVYFLKLESQTETYFEKIIVE